MKINYRHVIGGVVLVAILFGTVLVWQILPPRNFPVGTVTTILAGADVRAISEALESQAVVRSAFWFRLLVKFAGDENGVKAGRYYFEAPLTLFGVARRVTSGQFALQPLKVTIPEGLAAEDIAVILARSLPNFDANKFVISALPFEGQLFPDTYFLPPIVSEKEVVELMRENFNERIKALNNQIANSGFSLEQIVTMASLVEKEANQSDTRKLIAGILWKRYDAGMPLQVDVAKETYLYVNLPPAPIANPSLDAIVATIYPTESNFWFYLADKQGVTHFSKDYQEHLALKRKYL